ncbi:hypothetical protein F4678DRAFT_460375 [Xylaria arbuscula]|nr:hypothetical protein F4678DRAFT_460375 [Xylaria arbuscula]
MLNELLNNAMGKDFRTYVEDTVTKALDGMLPAASAGVEILGQVIAAEGPVLADLGQQVVEGSQLVAEAGRKAVEGPLLAEAGRKIAEGAQLVVAAGRKAMEDAVEWAVANPEKAVALAVGVVCIAIPMAVAGPWLAAMGFGADGIVAESLAAAFQSSIGNVVSPSLFAMLQSAGVAGYGTAEVSAVVQVAGLVLVAFSLSQSRF